MIFTLQAVLIEPPPNSSTTSNTQPPPPQRVPAPLSRMAHLRKKEWQERCQVSALSKRKSEELGCSVMLTGACCQSLRAAHHHHHHQSDHLTGQMRRLHQIFNTLTGGCRTCPGGTRSLPRQTSAPPSTSSAPPPPIPLASLHQCLHPPVSTALVPPADAAVSRQ